MDGPASNTRSREKGAETKEKKEDKKDRKATSISNADLPKQRLVSHFFASDKHYNSDSELETRGKNLLKKRSTSGKIYQSLFTFKNNMSQLNSQVGDMALSESQSTVQVNPATLTQVQVQVQGTDGVNHVERDEAVLNALNTFNAKKTTEEGSKGISSITTQIVTAVTTTPAFNVMSTNSNTSPVTATASAINTRMPNPIVGSTQIADEPQYKSQYPLMGSQPFNLHHNMYSQYPQQPTQPLYNQPAPPGIMLTQTTDPMILQMFQNINDKLTTIQSDVRGLKDSKIEITDHIAGIEFDQEDNNEQLMTQQQEIRVCQDQVKVLSDLAITYEEKFDNMTSKINQLEAKLMRSELLVFGLTEVKDKSCIDIAKNFFTQTMKINPAPEIVYAYWKGASKNKPMVIKLSNAQNKGQIYANVSNLKDVKNSKGKGYRVMDHLPEELAEEQVRARQVFAVNKGQVEGNKTDMSFKKGKLIVNNEPYCKKVSVPGAKQLLDEDNQTGSVNIQTLAGGDSDTEKGNKFIAYAANTKTLQEVRNVYLHIRKLHTGASHCSMAYRLAGINKAYDEDYLDHSEHGAGRRLLAKLIAKDEKCTSIYVVRYYSGIHIGQRRFEIHAELTDKALDDLKLGQCFTSKLPLKQLQDLPVKKKRSKQKVKTVNAPSGLQPRLIGAMALPPRANMQIEGTRFESMAYNRFCALQGNTSEDDTAKSNWEYKSLMADSMESLDEAHPAGVQVRRVAEWQDQIPVGPEGHTSSK